MTPEVFSAVAAWAWESSDPEAHASRDGAHRPVTQTVIAMALLAIHASPALRPRLFSSFATGTSPERSPWRACGTGDVSLS